MRCCTGLPSLRVVNSCQRLSTVLISNKFRENGVARVLSAFAVSMLVFFALYASCVWHPWTLLMPLAHSVRGAFFLWLSLVNVLAVSALWTVMADRFDSAEAKRLFGLLAAGATLGNAPFFAPEDCRPQMLVH